MKSESVRVQSAPSDGNAQRMERAHSMARAQRAQLQQRMERAHSMARAQRAQRMQRAQRERCVHSACNGHSVSAACTAHATGTACTAHTCTVGQRKARRCHQRARGALRA